MNFMAVSFCCLLRCVYITSLCEVMQEVFENIFISL
nr:MAG TPA: hypothetical protein [Caudoviricetes sp.]